MTKTNYNLSKITNRYKGKWIALNEHLTEVVSSGDTIENVLKEISQEDKSKVTLFKVPSKDLAFAGIL